MSDALIRPSALWGCGTWPCHSALLQAADTMQLRILRDSGGYTRRTGEAWAEWNQRSLRMCRVHFHKMQHERWSTFILRQIWQLHGHIARGCEAGRKLLAWKDLLWWQEQQRQRRGARHAGRFNPTADVEKSIVKIAGLHWKSQAQDRVWWKQQMDGYVENFNVPWASGKQKQLDNLKPNTAQRGTRRPQELQDREPKVTTKQLQHPRTVNSHSLCDAACVVRATHHSCRGEVDATCSFFEWNYRQLGGEAPACQVACQAPS